MSIRPSGEPDVQIVRFIARGHRSISETEELVLRIDGMPQLREAVQIWRYNPWHAWTKPILVERPQDIMEDDVQLIYWRDRDGLFGAAVPLSASGFRTTLGQVDGKFAARAAALASSQVPTDLPMIAVGYGRRPYEVIASTYRAALAVMDRTASSSRGKALPDELHYLGWNSWNASNLGRDLSSELMFSAAKTLRNAGVPVGWMTVDDGYFQQRDQLLLSFAPDPQKFPGGFRPMVDGLKHEYGIRYVGVWLALNGYWHGIAPEGQVGRDFAADLFNWTEKQDPCRADSPLRTGTFVRPDRPAIRTYYDQHLGARGADGFDFVKVDNQLVVERMARGNFPVWQLATAMHEGLNEAAAKHFGNRVINCMDLTAEAYFNFGRTPVARAVEDYFPYEAGETYNYEKGNAAAHVGQALYNSIYVSQFAVADFDMFESTNPNALMHAVARVASNGPIYLTDRPGHHDISLIQRLAMGDGRLLKADAPLRPCEDCLFQVQNPVVMKAFSRTGVAGILAAFNLADADRVTGSIKAGDVPGFASAVAYEHVSGRLARLSPAKPIPLDLKRFGVELWTLHKPRNGFAAFGRTDKLNGVAAVKSVRSSARQAAVVLHEGGPLAAYVAKRPSGVVVDGTASDFSYSRGLLRVDAPATGSASTTTIRFG